MAATELYYNVAMSRLDTQIQQIDQLDAKVATVFAFASGILAFFAGLLPLAASPMIMNHGIKIIALVLVAVALGIYLFIAYCIYRAYHVGTWDMRPDLKELEKNYLLQDDETLQRWIADECIRSMNSNEPLITRKGNLINQALKGLIAEVAFIAITGMVIFFAK